jgi:hypothetical protein
VTVDAVGRTVRFERPVLPPTIERVRISRLRVGDARLDLDLQRHHSGVSINVTRREGRVDVVAVK